MAKTVRMTTAQAIVKFLDNQYVSMDGVETKFVEGFFTIFGHGIAVGLGEALDTNPGQLKVLQGRNEQGMCHVATAFAKQSNRKKIIACASSIGPGAANMVTACATATVNNIPLLVFPADTFASRQPDPVLQQLEQSSSLAVSTNDAFKPVCKYWDRITRPEMVMTALINAEFLQIRLKQVHAASRFARMLRVSPLTSRSTSSRRECTGSQDRLQ